MTDQEIVKEVKVRQQYFERERHGWESDWKIITKLVNPRREFMDHNDYIKGSRIGTEMYDGTPSSALWMFASGLQGYTSSPGIDWFHWRMQRKAHERLPGVREWLDNCTEETYYQLGISNYYEELQKYFLDVGSIGTATLWPDWNPEEGKLNYICWHPKESYIQENAYGRVDTIHRRYKLTAKNAYSLFGKSLSQSVQDASKNTPYKEHEYLFAVYPNKDRLMGKLDNRNMAFQTVHIEYKGNDSPLRISGFRRFPAAVWRWAKNSNEPYGRSPAHQAIVDIQRLNTESKDMIQYKHLAVNPAWLAPSSLEDQFDISPGAVMWYERSLEEEMIKPVYSGADLSAGYQEIIDVRDIIEKHFFVDFFLMISRSDVEMTATEIIERQSEKATMLGPYVANMSVEAYNNILKNTFLILADNGRLPPPPESLRRIKGWGLTLEYTGPIHQAQKILFSSPRKQLDVMIPYGEVFPEMLDWYNPDEIFHSMGDAHGLAKRLRRTPEEVAQIRRARAEAERAQREIIAQKAIAEAGKDAAKAKLQDGTTLLDQFAQEAGLPRRKRA